MTNFEEVIAKRLFSPFSTFWNFCPYKIGMGEGRQQIMSIYYKGDTALLKYKPATNELEVLNDSGFDNGPIEN